MPLGTELKFIHERAHLSLEVAEALSSFAPEKNLTAPLFAGHSTYASLASDIPFILHPQPVPPAPMRAARGRARLALAVIALLAAAGWGVWLHGEAGRAASTAIGPVGFLARDLLPHIPGLIVAD